MHVVNAAAGIKKNGNTVWFWGDADLWFLWLDKIDTTVIAPQTLAMRKGFTRLDETNILAFLEKYKSCLVTKKFLRENLSRDDEIFYPAIVIDFDRKIFYDNFPEPCNFSLALGDGWTYSYDDIDDVVDPKEQYWQEHYEEND